MNLRLQKQFGEIGRVLASDRRGGSASADPWPGTARTASRGWSLRPRDSGMAT